MKYWVGVTDNSWFERLQAEQPDEVNFWQPTAKAPFTHLDAGTPFLFKLRRPNNHIAGGGFFVRFSQLPMALAWDAFGRKNGTESIDELRSSIGRLSRSVPISSQTAIGCTILASPFFFDRDDWIPMQEHGWADNIVRGKTYDTDLSDGSGLWTIVTERLAKYGSANTINDQDTQQPAYGAPFLARARLGQGSFRILVTEAYSRRCAITRESILPALDAAHIQPYGQGGPSKTANGLLLRSDFHKLFDAGLITVTSDLKVEVSARIKEEWFNGKAYYRLHGQPLHLPTNPLDRPGEHFLRWHNENVYAH